MKARQETGGPTEMAAARHDEQLRQLRRDLVEQLWTGMRLIALIGVPVSLSRYFITGWTSVYSVHVGVGLFTLIVAACRRWLPFDVLAIAFLCLLWTVGLPGVVAFGLSASSIWWLVLSSFVASTLYSVRVGVYLALATGLVMGIVGLGFITGSLTPPMDVSRYHAEPTAWMTLLLVTGAFAFLLLKTLGSHQRAVYQLLGRVRVQRDEVRDLYDHAPCGYQSLDAQGRIVKVNLTALRWLGYTEKELLGRAFADVLTAESQLLFSPAFSDFVMGGDTLDLELDLRRKDGSSIPVLLSASALRDSDGRFRMSRATMFDISDRRQLENELRRLARTDALTGLSTRHHFYAEATREIARARRRTLPLSVLLLDADHFKRINDRHGHAAGDQVLQALSGTLREVLREVDLPARLGGEEFAVLLPEVDIEDALAVGERLRDAIEQQQLVLESGATVRFTVSVGVSSLGAADPHIDELLRRADTALYEAKRQGRNRVIAEHPP